MERLRKRSEFLAVAKGRRINRPGFTLQVLPREGDIGGRFGFTVTKKLGGAPVRNRIRRRLREAVRLSLETAAAPAADIVVVGRNPALTLPFPRLCADMAESLADAGRPVAPSRAKRQSDKGAAGPTGTR